MEYCEEQERLIETEDSDGGWVDTHGMDPTSSGLDEKVSEMTIDDVKVTLQLTSCFFSLMVAQMFFLCHYNICLVN